MNKTEIKELRQKLGLSQERFGQQIGVSFVTVNNWEAGRTKPSPLALEKLKQLAEEVAA